MLISAFDFETRSKDATHQEFALQAWRPEFEVSSLAVAYFNTDTKEYKSICSSHRSEFDEMLRSTIDISDIIFCHNAMFDLGCLKGAIDFEDKLLDTLLLSKWLWTLRIKKRESFSLKNVAKLLFKETHKIADTSYTLKDWEVMKEQEIAANFQTSNTLTYNALDTYVCLQIGFKILGQFASCLRTGKSCETSYIKAIRSIQTEAACLQPSVQSYLGGICVDMSLVQQLKIEFEEKLKTIEQELNLPATLLASPKQLSELMYTAWGIPQNILSDKTGMPSTSKSALKLVTDERVQKILEWKETKTLLDKFIISTEESVKYCDSANITHPQPTLFGTYTGRVIYSSKILKKFPGGIAIHQIPRNKKVRNIIIPPPGMKLVEFDASTQEIRLLAQLSGDQTLIKLLKEQKDIHSYTGSVLGGITYDEFMRRYKENDPIVAGEKGLRYCGKFINLSCQYRIGKNKLAQRAKIDYGIDLSIDEAQHFKNTYIKAYPGVRNYWNKMIKQAHSEGFVETLGGRAIELNYLDPSFTEWELDSTAINFPIQGSGADMKEIALTFLSKNFKELYFYFDLHDGLWFYADNNLTDDYLIAAKEGLENMCLYESPWHTKIDVPLLWDISVGTAMGAMSKLGR